MKTVGVVGWNSVQRAFPIDKGPSSKSPDNKGQLSPTRLWALKRAQEDCLTWYGFCHEDEREQADSSEMYTYPSQKGQMSVQNQLRTEAAEEMDSTSEAEYGGWEKSAEGNVGSLIK